MQKKNKVNLITSFINPSVFFQMKTMVGLKKKRSDYELDSAFGRDDAFSTIDEFFSVALTEEKRSQLNFAIVQSQRYLFDIQKSDGHWIGELEANITLTAEFIMLMHFMDLVDPKKVEKSAAYIKRKQLSDGSWPIFFNGDGDISTTVEAYFALKLAGTDYEAPCMVNARQFILAHGGITKVRMITKIMLAFFGQYDWRGVPVLPVEMIYIPRVCSFNIYEFSSWARICVVPLTILMHYKPFIQIDSYCDISELYVGHKDQVDFEFNTDQNLISWHNFFVGVDRVLKLLENSPLRISTERALAKAERWILDHQDDSGDWGGIFPAMAFSIMALRMRGYSNDYEPIKKGFEAIERFQIKTDTEIHQQSCVSPVWDTAWTLCALQASGIDSSDTRLLYAAQWLYQKQTTRRGDWQIKNKNLEPGGWAFEYYNEFYPDTDDTGIVLMALRRFQDLEGIDTEARLRKALNWLLNLQNTDGGWGAFDKDVNNPIYNEILFNDLKTMLDPSCPDITGRTLELLGELGYGSDFLPASAAIEYLKREQHPDGPWFGRWGVNYIYGTWAVLTGLARIGVDIEQEYMQRAIQWLFAIQNTDGGWGESCLSYHHKKYIGKGTSTPSQTSWALIALVACGLVEHPHVQNGIQFLLDSQQANGTWDESEFTGTGFPHSFYIRYHMYKDYFPLLTLSTYKKALTRAEKKQ